MKGYKARKKIKHGEHKGKVGGKIVEVGEKKGNIEPDVKIAENLAGNAFKQFATKKNIDFEKEKKQFEIEYLGNDRIEVLEKLGLPIDDERTGIDEQKFEKIKQEHEKNISIKKTK